MTSLRIVILLVFYFILLVFYFGLNRGHCCSGQNLAIVLLRHPSYREDSTVCFKDVLPYTRGGPWQQLAIAMLRHRQDIANSNEPINNLNFENTGSKQGIRFYDISKEQPVSTDNIQQHHGEPRWKARRGWWNDIQGPWGAVLSKIQKCRLMSVIQSM